MPVAGEAIRLVRCEHQACGAETGVRLPDVLPAKVVRRVVCDGCRRPFECDYVLDAGVVAAGVLPATRARSGLFSPEGHAWRYLSLPVAAAAVIGSLHLIQG